MKPSRFNCNQIQRRLAPAIEGGKVLWVPVGDSYYPQQTAINTMNLIIERRENGYVPEYRVVDVSDTPRFKQLIEQE